MLYSPSLRPEQIEALYHLRVELRCPTPRSPRSRNCCPASRGGNSPRRRSRTAPWNGIPAGATVWGSMGIPARGPALCGATKG